MATESTDGRSAPAQSPSSSSSVPERRQALTRQRPPQRPVAAVDKILSPNTLGWLSIALGAVALLAPSPLARWTGLGGRKGLLPLVGLRELASGVGLLTQRKQTPWLWSRVAGDVIDLALISSACGRGNLNRGRAVGAAGVVAAIATADLAAATRSSARTVRAVPAGPISEALIVNKTPQQCYEFWAGPNNLPRFCAAIDSVAQIDEHHSRWMLRDPPDSTVALTMKMTLDESTKRIAWHSVGRSDFAYAGVAHFHPAAGNRGTLVAASVLDASAGGQVGARIASLVGADPHTRLRDDLRRFKQLIETGEVATTRGQPSGRRSRFARLIPEGRRSRQKDLT